MQQKRNAVTKCKKFYYSTAFVLRISFVKQQIQTHITFCEAEKAVHCIHKQDDKIFFDL